MSEPSVIQVALQCAEAFEQVQAGYFLGGSLASSLQGEPRATNDIDFVVDLQPAQVEPLKQALGSDATRTGHRRGPVTRRTHSTTSEVTESPVCPSCSPSLLPHTGQRGRGDSGA
jgi:hypothetical protein